MLVRGLRGRPPFNNVPELECSVADAARPRCQRAHRGLRHTSKDTASLAASFPALRRAVFPFKKDARSKKKKSRKRGKKEFSTAVTCQSQTAALSPVRGWGGWGGGAGATGTDYLGSSITPLLRSVILGYFTFFWSSSF